MNQYNYPDGTNGTTGLTVADAYAHDRRMESLKRELDTYKMINSIRYENYMPYVIPVDTNDYDYDPFTEVIKILLIITIILFIYFLLTGI